MPGSIKKYKGRSFEFYEDTRGFYYLRMVEGEELVEDDLTALHSWMDVSGFEVQKPLLLELGYGSSIAPQVQKYLAGTLARFSTADAILISTFAHKLMATFYLRQYKPTLPTRVFSDVFEALDWIEKQRVESPLRSQP